VTSRRIEMEMRVVSAAAPIGMSVVGEWAESSVLQPAQAGIGSLQALTIPVERVDRGDVVAVGQRFYGVDSVVQTNHRFGFPLIALRSLESGARAAIEFRNSGSLVSILRLRGMARVAGESVAVERPPSTPRLPWGWFD
jgi:hypothetical protein